MKLVTSMKGDCKSTATTTLQDFVIKMMEFICINGNMI